MKEAWASGIQPIRQFVNMLRNHWYGIKTYFKKLSTNAFAERVNLKIQEIKRIAKGYRNINNYKMMIYLHLGGLNFD
jgi:transposase